MSSLVNLETIPPRPQQGVPEGMMTEQMSTSRLVLMPLEPDRLRLYLAQEDAFNLRVAPASRRILTGFLPFL